MVRFPPNPGPCLKKKTARFTFGLVTETTKIKWVDFCPQHHELIKSLSVTENTGEQNT